MKNKITLFKPYKSISLLLKLGVFNTLLAIGSGCLFLVWLWFAINHLTGTCLCGKKMESFLFLEHIFPAIMGLDYLIKWLAIFLVSALLEVVILSFLAIKSVRLEKAFALFPRLAFLSFAHNTPGFFLILVLMSKTEYSILYKALFVLSAPLIFVFKVSKHKNFILYPTSVSYELIPRKSIKTFALYSLCIYFGYLTISTGLLILLPLYVILGISYLFQ